MSRPFEDALRTELMRSIRNPSRRPRRLGIVAVAGIAALVIALTSLIDTDTARADVEITREHGRVEVLLTDLKTSAEDVRAALAEEGLSVIVRDAPVGPSNVGRFVGESTTPGDVRDVRRVSEVGVAFMGFSIPDDWDGTLTVLLGRPARDGEPYELFSDAYAPGEPLACSGTLGGRLSDATGALEGYEVSVRAEDESPLPPTDLYTALRDGRGEEIMTSGFALSATELLITVASTPADLTLEPAC